MAKAGLSPMIRELWLGQSLAEMEHERQTILGAGQEKSRQYGDEYDWLRGNVVALRSSQRWSQLGQALNFGAKVAGTVDQTLRDQQRRNEQQRGGGYNG